MVLTLVNPFNLRCADFFTKRHFYTFRYCHCSLFRLLYVVCDVRACNVSILRTRQRVELSTIPVISHHIIAIWLVCEEKQELSYRQQIARKLCTRYAEGIYIGINITA